MRQAYAGHTARHFQRASVQAADARSARMRWSLAWASELAAGRRVAVRSARRPMAIAGMVSGMLDVPQLPSSSTGPSRARTACRASPAAVRARQATRARADGWPGSPGAWSPSPTAPARAVPARTALRRRPARWNAAAESAASGRPCLRGAHGRGARHIRRRMLALREDVRAGATGACSATNWSWLATSMAGLPGLPRASAIRRWPGPHSHLRPAPRLARHRARHRASHHAAPPVLDSPPKTDSIMIDMWYQPRRAEAGLMTSDVQTRRTSEYAATQRAATQVS